MEYTEEEMTPWFSIDRDGQPVRPGWYACLYAGDTKWDGLIWYWSGNFWLYGENSGETEFGNGATKGECWRGLLARPATNDKG